MVTERQWSIVAEGVIWFSGPVDAKAVVRDLFSQMAWPLSTYIFSLLRLIP